MSFFNGHISELGKVDQNLLAPLTTKVLANDHLWDIEDKKKLNKFTVFSATRHIVFQYPENLNCHTVSNYTPMWDEWKDVIEPVIDAVTRIYKFKLGKTARIILANLCPGGEIAIHIDQNPSAEVPHKIHVPIQTDELAEFFEEKSSYYLRRGFAYEVNNRIAHGVKNSSANDRIHLIFDYYDAAVS